MEASRWTVQQVATWLAEQGFDDLAKVFADQDIDGEALLTLDFTDERLMGDFGLTWGKANKLKKAVVALGGDSNAPTGTMMPSPPAGTYMPGAATSAGHATNAVPMATVLPPHATVVAPQAGPRHIEDHSAIARKSTFKREMKSLGLENLQALPIVKPIAQGGKDDNVKIDEEAVQNLIHTMLTHGEDGDIDVAIVSVMGKFRGGKSFLLNLLANYFLWLEKNQDRLRHHPRKRDTEYRFHHDMHGHTDWLPEWLPEEISTPFKVDAESDTQTCTKGLWILNRPFFLRKFGSDKKLALLLLDSQGADDGVLDESQSRAILGITTVFSSSVIYNVKMPLDTKHVKDLSDLANIFQVAIGDIQASGEADLTPEQQSFGSLLFLLRDARFKEGDSVDECCKKLKKETANKLDPEQALINKERVKQLHQSFKKPMPGPFGLPHPGDDADFMRSATTNNMRLLNDSFKILLDDFVMQNFEHNFPVPVKRILKNKPLTASTFVEYLERIKEAFAACMVAGGDPELVLMHREELAEEAFIRTVDDINPEGQDAFPVRELEELKQEAFTRFAKLLESGLTKEAQDRWVKRFKEFMDGYVAKRENKYMMKQGHGDKALGAMVGSGAVMLVTPLGPFVFAHWIIATIAGAGMVAAGYVRHAHDNGKAVASPLTMGSFAKVTILRCRDVAMSIKRYATKFGALFGMASKMRAANNNSNMSNNVM